MIIWRQSLAHFNLRCHLSFLFALMDHHSTLWSSAVIFLGRGKLKTSRSLLKLCHFSAFQWLVTTDSPLILGNYVLSCPVSLTGSLITSLEDWNLEKSCFRTTHPNIFAHPIVQTKQFSHVLTIGCFVIRKLLAEPSGNQIELSQLQKPIQRCSGLSLFSGTDSNNNNNYSDI